MMKKFLKTAVISLTLGLTSTAALADQLERDHRRHDGDAQLMMKRQPMRGPIVVDAQYATQRAGTVTLDVGRGAKRADLALVATDGLAIRRVMIEYASGKQLVLRGNRDGRIDLPDGGRITAVHVQYVNRGNRGATIKLVAKGERPGRGRFAQRG